MYKLSTILMFLVWACLHSTLFAQQAAADTLNGIVEEYEHNSEGDVLSLVLSVLDEDYNIISYIIAKNAKGTELLDFIGQNIDVIGYIKNNSDGSKSITVVDYSVTEDDDYDSPPDDLDEEE